MANDYLNDTIDYNTAMLRLLQVRYSTTSTDLSSLLSRYQNEAQDYSENMETLLRKIAEGLEEETAATSGGFATT